MARENTVRRLAAIMSADVVGYSRLMGIDEAGTLEALRAHRAELIDPAIVEHDGRIVKLMGDGLLVEFASAIQAVECAVAIQQGMTIRNANVPDGRMLDFRIGINLGDVVVDGDDIHGDGVNVAARLQELAEPDGVLISGTIFEQVDGKVDQRFADLGSQQMKNIDKLIRVYSVIFPSVKSASENHPMLDMVGGRKVPSHRRVSVWRNTIQGHGIGARYQFLPLPDLSAVKRRPGHRGIDLPHRGRAVHQGRAEILQVVTVRRTRVLRQLWV